MSVLPNKISYVVGLDRDAVEIACDRQNMYVYKIIIETNRENDNVDDSEYEQHEIRATKVMHEVRQRRPGITHRQ